MGFILEKRGLPYKCIKCGAQNFELVDPNFGSTGKCWLCGNVTMFVFTERDKLFTPLNENLDEDRT